ncbi:hypothetical protein L596_014821 [Steinernema carpocapsae]|uniref:WW domain-containing protein n=1 Tax=Steinernema carpocapsae TaxID=34508 RepID=A0A4V6A2X0_STECR|nr:hypothetical protein L596_014821 [Steinernema carpocapsae]
MSEYWVSNAKKFCEICKVWMADNTITVQRHETGEKHKAMLAQKLRNIGQERREREAADLNLQATLAQMEQAAVASMKGLPSKKAPGPPESTRKKYFSVKKASSVEETARQIEERDKQRKELLKRSQKSEFWKDDEQEEICWVQSEAQEDGNMYYWNIFTAETQWETPGRFYTAEEYTKKYTELAQEAQQAASKAEEEFLSKLDETGPSIAIPEFVPKPKKATKREKQEMEAKVKAAQKALHCRPVMMPANVGLEEIPLPEPGPTTSRVAPELTADDLNRIPVSLVAQPKVEVAENECYSHESHVKSEIIDGDSEQNDEPQQKLPKMFVPPPLAHGPYGAWVKVEKKPELKKEEVEFDPVEPLPPVVKLPEEDFEFVEKTATVSKKKGVVEFKKRKIGNRNTRVSSRD